MASVENGPTTVINITNALTPVGKGSPNENFSEIGYLPFSLVSQFDSDDNGLTGSITDKLIPANPTVTLNYYKMAGYYLAGAITETWVVSGSPSLSPPSGHTLQDVRIVTTWIK